MTAFLIPGAAVYFLRIRVAIRIAGLTQQLWR